MLSIFLVEDEARDVELANGTVEVGNGGLFVCWVQIRWNVKVRLGQKENERETRPTETGERGSGFLVE